MKIKKFTKILEQLSAETLTEMLSNVKEISDSFKEKQKIISSTKQTLENYLSNSDTTNTQIDDAFLNLSTIETKINDILNLLEQVDSKLNNTNETGERPIYGNI